MTLLHRAKTVSKDPTRGSRWIWQGKYYKHYKRANHKIKEYSIWNGINPKSFKLQSIHEWQVEITILKNYYTTISVRQVSLVAQTVKNLLAMQEIDWVWSLGKEDPWRRARQPTPAFLPREPLGQRSLKGYSHQESDMSETA